MGHDLPGHGQYEAQGVIGDLVDAIVGNVGHRDTVLARRVQVHVVNANAIAHDRPRPGHRRDHRGAESGKLGDDCISTGYRCFQLCLGFAMVANQYTARVLGRRLLQSQIGKLVVGDNNGRF